MENNFGNPDSTKAAGLNGAMIYGYRSIKPWPPVGLVLYHLVLPFAVLFITQIIALICGFIVFLNSPAGAAFLSQISSLGLGSTEASGVNQDFFLSVAALMNDMLASPVFLIAMASSYVMTILIYVFIAGRFEKQKLSTLGFTLQKPRGLLYAVARYLFGLGLGLAMMSAVFLIFVLTGQMSIVSFGLQTRDLAVFIFYILMWIPQGASEEIMIRGYMMPRLGDAFGKRIAIISSSVFFGFMHMSNSGFSLIPFVNLILVGVLFAMLALRTQEIWTVCGLHSMWNFAQGNLFGFKVSGISVSASVIQSNATPDSISFVTGGAFGPEGGLAVTAVLAIAIGYLFIFRAPGNALGRGNS